MRWFRNRPWAVAEMELQAPERVAVRIGPGSGHSAGELDHADRVRMAVAAVSLAYTRAPERRIPAFKECLVEAAGAAAVGRAAERAVHLGPLGVREFLVLAPADREPRGRVVIEQVQGRRSTPLPRLVESPDFAGPSVEIASLALICATAGELDADGQLTLGLGVEGVLAWFQQAHRMSQPGDVAVYALAHAVSRMEQAGRTPPPDLL